MKLVFHLFYKVAFIVVSMSILFSGKTHAQAKDTLLPIYQLSPVTITALRIPIKESSVPFSITVMPTRKNIQGLSLAESLAGLPGIEVNARYNLSVGDRITNRGFGARTQFGVRGVRIIVDDIPSTMADGQSNLEMIDLHDLSYVELLRGPGSSLYGNASGGVLKLYTNPFPSIPFHLSFSSTNGADGLFRWNSTFGSAVAKTKVSGSITKFYYDGYRAHSKADFSRAIIKLSYTLSSADILLINAGYVHFIALSPGSLTQKEVAQNSKLANPLSVTNNAGEKGSQFQLTATWKHQKDSNTLFQINSYGIYRSVNNLIVGKIIELPQNAQGLDAIYDKKFSIMRQKIHWSIGTDIERRFNNRKNYTNNSGLRGQLFVNQDERIMSVGLFTQVLVPVNLKMDIAGSIRYDLTSFGVTDFLSSSQNFDNSGNRIMKGMSPSLGIVYRLSKSLNCFANFATSFETPTSTELANRPGGIGGFNPDLNPSHALEYEAGIRGSLLNSIFRYDLTGYLINIKDELIPFEVQTDAPGGQVYYRNAGSDVHRGIEIVLTYFPLPFLKTRLSLTYIDAYFKNYVVNGIDYTGNKVPGITPTRVTAEITYYAPIKLYISLMTQNYGKVMANDANSAKVNPYTVFDLDIGQNGISFGKDQKIKLELSCGISNIFNIHYISSVTINANAERYYEPAPGRSFFLNVRLAYR